MGRWASPTATPGDGPAIAPGAEGFPPGSDPLPVSLDSEMVRPVFGRTCPRPLVEHDP